MNNFDQNQDNLFDLKVDTKAQEHLRVSAQWARILAITGFASAGVSLVAAIVEGEGNTAAIVGQIFGSFIVIGITILIYIFLYKFAVNMRDALAAMNQDLFNIAFRNLRTYFIILGILFIIGLSCGLLFLVGFLSMLTIR